MKFEYRNSVIQSRNKYTAHNYLCFAIFYPCMKENIIYLLPKIFHIEPKYKEHIIRSKILQCLNLWILYNPQIEILSVDIMVIIMAFRYLQE